MIVRVMVGAGYRQELIAAQLQIDRKTLRKHYRAELKRGTDDANAMVAQSLFKKATSNGPQSVAAAIWWEKTRAGKKDTSRVLDAEISTPGGSTVRVVLEARDANL